MKPTNDSRLFGAAKFARDQAYNPYSNHAVGAVVQSTGGAIFTGCNVENSSYGVTMCAERNALGSAITAGAQNILQVVIVSDKSEPAWPCGMCRQALAEFGEMAVWTEDENGNFKRMWLSELLPERFEL